MAWVAMRDKRHPSGMRPLMETGEEELMVVKSLSVPPGLEALMEGLTREVLKFQPKDIYAFASEHFERLMKIRDAAGAEYQVRKSGKGQARTFKKIPQGKGYKLDKLTSKPSNQDVDQIKSEASTAEIDKITAPNIFSGVNKLSFGVADMQKSIGSLKESKSESSTETEIKKSLKDSKSVSEESKKSLRGSKSASQNDKSLDGTKTLSKDESKKLRGSKSASIEDKVKNDGKILSKEEKLSKKSLSKSISQEEKDPKKQISKSDSLEDKAIKKLVKSVSKDEKDDKISKSTKDDKEAKKQASKSTSEDKETKKSLDKSASRDELKKQLSKSTSKEDKEKKVLGSKSTSKDLSKKSDSTSQEKGNKFDSQDSKEGKKLKIKSSSKGSLKSEEKSIDKVPIGPISGTSYEVAKTLFEEFAEPTEEINGNVEGIIKKDTNGMQEDTVNKIEATTEMVEAKDKIEETGLKKEAMDENAAAIKIQSQFRGFRSRKNSPLKQREETKEDMETNKLENKETLDKSSENKVGNFLEVAKEESLKEDIKEAEQEIIDIGDGEEEQKAAVVIQSRWKQKQANKNNLETANTTGVEENAENMPEKNTLVEKNIKQSDDKVKEDLQQVPKEESLKEDIKEAEQEIIDIGDGEEEQNAAVVIQSRWKQKQAKKNQLETGIEENAENIPEKDRSVEKDIKQSDDKVKEDLQQEDEPVDIKQAEEKLPEDVKVEVTKPDDDKKPMLAKTKALSMGSYEDDFDTDIDETRLSSADTRNDDNISIASNEVQNYMENIMNEVEKNETKDVKSKSMKENAAEKIVVKMDKTKSLDSSFIPQVSPEYIHIPLKGPLPTLKKTEDKNSPDYVYIPLRTPNTDAMSIDSLEPTGIKVDQQSLVDSLEPGLIAEQQSLIDSLEPNIKAEQQSLNSEFTDSSSLQNVPDTKIEQQSINSEFTDSSNVPQSLESQSIHLEKDSLNTDDTLSLQNGGRSADSTFGAESSETASGAAFLVLSDGSEPITNVQGSVISDSDTSSNMQETIVPDGIVENDSLVIIDTDELLLENKSNYDKLKQIGEGEIDSTSSLNDLTKITNDDGIKEVYDKDEEDAAIKIQTTWKAKNAKKKKDDNQQIAKEEEIAPLDSLKTEVTETDRPIKSPIPTTVVRAAVKIQSLWRGFKSRREKQETDELKKLQKPAECDELPWQRGESYEISNEMENAATKIQARFRGYKSRQQTNLIRLPENANLMREPIKEEEDEEIEELNKRLENFKQSTTDKEDVKEAEEEPDDDSKELNERLSKMKQSVSYEAAELNKSTENTKENEETEQEPDTNELNARLSKMKQSVSYEPEEVKKSTDDTEETVEDELSERLTSLNKTFVFDPESFPIKTQEDTEEETDKDSLDLNNRLSSLSKNNLYTSDDNLTERSNKLEVEETDKDNEDLNNRLLSLSQKNIPETEEKQDNSSKDNGGFDKDDELNKRLSKLSRSSEEKSAATEILSEKKVSQDLGKTFVSQTGEIRKSNENIDENDLNKRLENYKKSYESTTDLKETVQKDDEPLDKDEEDLNKRLASLSNTSLYEPAEILPEEPTEKEDPKDDELNKRLSSLSKTYSNEDFVKSEAIKTASPETVDAEKEKLNKRLSEMSKNNLISTEDISEKPIKKDEIEEPVDKDSEELNKRLSVLTLSNLYTSDSSLEKVDTKQDKDDTDKGNEELNKRLATLKQSHKYQAIDSESKDSADEVEDKDSEINNRLSKLKQTHMFKTFDASSVDENFDKDITNADEMNSRLARLQQTNLYNSQMSNTSRDKRSLIIEDDGAKARLESHDSEDVQMFYMDDRKDREESEPREATLVTNISQDSGISNKDEPQRLSLSKINESSLDEEYSKESGINTDDYKYSGASNLSLGLNVDQDYSSAKYDAPDSRRTSLLSPKPDDNAVEGLSAIAYKMATGITAGVLGDSILGAIEGRRDSKQEKAEFIHIPLKGPLPQEEKVEQKENKTPKPGQIEKSGSVEYIYIPLKSPGQEKENLDEIESVKSESSFLSEGPKTEPLISPKSQGGSDKFEVVINKSNYIPTSDNESIYVPLTPRNESERNSISSASTEIVSDTPYSHDVIAVIESTPRDSKNENRIRNSSSTLDNIEMIHSSMETLKVEEPSKNLQSPLKQAPDKNLDSENFSKKESINEISVDEKDQPKNLGAPLKLDPGIEDSQNLKDSSIENSSKEKTGDEINEKSAEENSDDSPGNGDKSKWGHSGEMHDSLELFPEESQNDDKNVSQTAQSSEQIDASGVKVDDNSNLIDDKIAQTLSHSSELHDSIDSIPLANAEAVTKKEVSQELTHSGEIRESVDLPVESTETSQTDDEKLKNQTKLIHSSELHESLEMIPISPQKDENENEKLSTEKHPLEINTEVQTEIQDQDEKQSTEIIDNKLVNLNEMPPEVDEENNIATEVRKDEKQNEISEDDKLIKSIEKHDSVVAKIKDSGTEKEDTADEVEKADSNATSVESSKLVSSSEMHDSVAETINVSASKTECVSGTTKEDNAEDNKLINSVSAEDSKLISSSEMHDSVVSTKDISDGKKEDLAEEHKTTGLNATSPMVPNLVSSSELHDSIVETTNVPASDIDGSGTIKEDDKLIGLNTESTEDSKLINSSDDFVFSTKDLSSAKKVDTTDEDDKVTGSSTVSAEDSKLVSSSEMHDSAELIDTSASKTTDVSDAKKEDAMDEIDKETGSTTAPAEVSKLVSSSEMHDSVELIDTSASKTTDVSDAKKADAMDEIDKETGSTTAPAEVSKLVSSSEMHDSVELIDTSASKTTDVSDAKKEDAMDEIDKETGSTTAPAEVSKLVSPSEMHDSVEVIDTSASKTTDVSDANKEDAIDENDKVTGSTTASADDFKLVNSSEMHDSVEEMNATSSKTTDISDAKREDVTDELDKITGSATASAEDSKLINSSEMHDSIISTIDATDAKKEDTTDEVVKVTGSNAPPIVESRLINSSEMHDSVLSTTAASGATKEDVADEADKITNSNVPSAMESKLVNSNEMHDSVISTTNLSGANKQEAADDVNKVNASNNISSEDSKLVSSSEMHDSIAEIIDVTDAKNENTTEDVDKQIDSNTTTEDSKLVNLSEIHDSVVSTTDAKKEDTIDANDKLNDSNATSTVASKLVSSGEMHDNVVSTTDVSSAKKEDTPVDNLGSNTTPTVDSPQIPGTDNSKEVSLDFKEVAGVTFVSTALIKTVEEPDDEIELIKDDELENLDPNNLDQLGASSVLLDDIINMAKSPSRRMLESKNSSNDLKQMSDDTKPVKLDSTKLSTLSSDDTDILSKTSDSIVTVRDKNEKLDEEISEPGDIENFTENYVTKNDESGKKVESTTISPSSTDNIEDKSTEEKDTEKETTEPKAKLDRTETINSEISSLDKSEDNLNDVESKEKKKSYSTATTLSSDGIETDSSSNDLNLKDQKSENNTENSEKIYSLKDSAKEEANDTKNDKLLEAEKNKVEANNVNINLSNENNNKDVDDVNVDKTNKETTLEENEKVITLNSDKENKEQTLNVSAEKNDDNTPKSSEEIEKNTLSENTNKMATKQTEIPPNFGKNEANSSKVEGLLHSGEFHESLELIPEPIQNIPPINDTVTKQEETMKTQKLEHSGEMHESLELVPSKTQNDEKSQELNKNVEMLQHSSENHDSLDVNLIDGSDLSEKSEQGLLHTSEMHDSLKLIPTDVSETQNSETSHEDLKNVEQTQKLEHSSELHDSLDLNLIDGSDFSEKSEQGLLHSSEMHDSIDVNSLEATENLSDSQGMSKISEADESNKNETLSPNFLNIKSSVSPIDIRNISSSPLGVISTIEESEELGSESENLKTDSENTSSSIDKDIINKYTLKSINRQHSVDPSSHRKLFDEIDTIIETYGPKRQISSDSETNLGSVKLENEGQDLSVYDSMPDANSTNKAAVKIQSSYRGYSTRKRLTALPQKKVQSVENLENTKDVASDEQNDEKGDLVHSSEMHDSLQLPPDNSSVAQENETGSDEQNGGKGDLVHSSEMHDSLQLPPDASSVTQENETVRDEQNGGKGDLAHSSEMHDSLQLPPDDSSVAQENETVSDEQNGGKKDLVHSSEMHDSLQLPPKDPIVAQDESKKLLHSSEMHDSLEMNQTGASDVQNDSKFENNTTLLTRDSLESKPNEASTVEQLVHSSEMYDSLEINPTDVSDTQNGAKFEKTTLQSDSLGLKRNDTVDKDNKLINSSEMHETIVQIPTENTDKDSEDKSKDSESSSLTNSVPVPEITPVTAVSLVKHKNGSKTIELNDKMEIENTAQTTNDSESKMKDSSVHNNDKDYGDAVKKESDIKDIKIDDSKVLENILPQIEPLEDEQINENKDTLETDKQDVVNTIDEKLADTTEKLLHSGEFHDSLIIIPENTSKKTVQDDDTNENNLSSEDPNDNIDNSEDIETENKEGEDKTGININKEYLNSEGEFVFRVIESKTPQKANNTKDLTKEGELNESTPDSQENSDKMDDIDVTDLLKLENTNKKSASKIKSEVDLNNFLETNIAEEIKSNFEIKNIDQIKSSETIHKSNNDEENTENTEETSDENDGPVKFFIGEDESPINIKDIKDDNNKRDGQKELNSKDLDGKINAKEDNNNTVEQQKIEPNTTVENAGPEKNIEKEANKSLLDEDAAATKIQKSYRNYRKKRSIESKEDPDEKEDSDGKEDTFSATSEEINEILQDANILELEEKLEDVPSSDTTPVGELKDQEVHNAATKIQSTYRGFRTRREIQNKQFTQDVLETIPETETPRESMVKEEPKNSELKDEEIESGKEIDGDMEDVEKIGNDNLNIDDKALLDLKSSANDNKSEYDFDMDSLEENVHNIPPLDDTKLVNNQSVSDEMVQGSAISGAGYDTEGHTQMHQPGEMLAIDTLPHQIGQQAKNEMESQGQRFDSQILSRTEAANATQFIQDGGDTKTIAKIVQTNKMPELIEFIPQDPTKEVSKVEITNLQNPSLNYTTETITSKKKKTKDQQLQIDLIPLDGNTVSPTHGLGHSSEMHDSIGYISDEMAEEKEEGKRRKKKKGRSRHGSGDRRGESHDSIDIFLSSEELSQGQVYVIIVSCLTRY